MDTAIVCQACYVGAHDVLKLVSLTILALHLTSRDGIRECRTHHLALAVYTRPRQPKLPVLGMDSAVRKRGLHTNSIFVQMTTNSCLCSTYHVASTYPYLLRPRHRCTTTHINQLYNLAILRNLFPTSLDNTTSWLNIFFNPVHIRIVQPFYHGRTRKRKRKRHKEKIWRRAEGKTARKKKKVLGGTSTLTGPSRYSTFN